MRNIGILGTGRYLPENIVTNKDLEEIVEDTSAELIFQKTGIRERRIADREEATSDLATNAALNAIQKANIDINEINLLVIATCTPDTIMPSTACVVQHNLGLKNCTAFDLSAACSGFVYALTVAADMMRANETYKKALVIGADEFSRIIDWTDNSTCLFFGDGAGAVVIGDNNEGSIMPKSYLRSDGSGSKYIYVPAGGSRIPVSQEVINNNLHFLKMQGRSVWEFATNVFPEAVNSVLSRNGYTINDVSLIIPHQANARLIEQAMGNLGCSGEKAFVNVDKYANTSGASIPIALDEAVEAKIIGKEDLVVLVGFGSGLTYGSCIIKW